MCKEARDLGRKLNASIEESGRDEHLISLSSLLFAFYPFALLLSLLSFYSLTSFKKKEK